jgi:hypothetical protein
MPCEHFKNALTEAAIAGREPQAEMRAHLDDCLSCQTYFAEERSVFSAIDESLRATANAEVPPSLLPQVRVALRDAPGPKSFTSVWFALAGAAALIFLLLLARTTFHSGAQDGRTDVAVIAKPRSPETSPQPGETAPVPAPSVRAAAPAQPQTPKRRRSIEAPTGSPEAEILVPRDQELLVVQYAAEWHRRKRAPLVAQNSGSSELELLEMAPIQIAQLDVKLLTESQSQ